MILRVKNKKFSLELSWVLKKSYLTCWNSLRVLKRRWRKISMFEDFIPLGSVESFVNFGPYRTYWVFWILVCWWLVGVYWDFGDSLKFVGTFMEKVELVCYLSAIYRCWIYGAKVEICKCVFVSYIESLQRNLSLLLL